MPATGGALERLTADPAIDSQPAWSSTGTIAFASDRTGDFDIYGIDEHGGALRHLTTLSGHDADASWSPDGSQLAFAHDHGNGDFDVYAVGADGQNARPLVTTTTNDHFPSWSPDGTRIAFVRDAEIVVMPAAGGLAQALGATGSDPNWGPLPTPAGPPDLGRTVTVTPTGGAQILIAPATNEAPSTSPTIEAQLRTANEVPVGTTIDASRGTVAVEAVTTTPDGPGTVGRAEVTGGVFTVNQVGDSEPTLRMLPGIRPCQGARAAAVPPEARMRIRARGRFRSVAGYGRAAARGTEWSVRERCDGTIFQVFDGVVLVHDYRRKLSFRVRAGQCYLAAKRRRTDALKPKPACPPVGRSRR
jgi:hypothetical protein